MLTVGDLCATHLGRVVSVDVVTRWQHPDGTVTEQVETRTGPLARVQHHPRDYTPGAESGNPQTMLVVGSWGGELPSTAPTTVEEATRNG